MTRHTEPRKRFAAIVAAFALLFSALVIMATPAQASGNSGTIKIHAKGSPPGTESNEPHVCAFNIEAFGFAEGFDGHIEFDVQGGDGPLGVAAGPFVVGPADEAGYFATNYFNDATGPVIQNGHYKVTLYGKFNDGRINYDDVKAKSKVFKVDCPTPPPTPAAPAAVTASDVCEPATGPTHDRITIPTDANFTYQVDGKDVAAGPFVATGTTHTARAVAKAGVVVQQGATTQWTFTFTKVACADVLGVSATRVRGAVKAIDKCGRAGDSFLAKRVRGVTYLVKGSALREGVWLKAKTRTVRVRAVASNQRYAVVGQDVWVLRFTNKPCATPPQVLPETGA